MRSASLVPDPMYSDQQYAQFYHQDIDSLSDARLRIELYARGLRLYELSDDPDQRKQISWLEERVTKIEEELARRRNTEVYNANSSNRPKLSEGVKL